MVGALSDWQASLNFGIFEYISDCSYFRSCFSIYTFFFFFFGKMMPLTLSNEDRTLFAVIKIIVNDIPRWCFWEEWGKRIFIDCKKSIFFLLLIFYVCRLFEEGKTFVQLICRSASYKE